ncbi:transcription factor BTF3 homolog 4 [Drosophila erecta]|uniref:Transcription factor BTF3 n=1 Tax=Drosophila erecta TaxID=7220 RepID=B3NV04_DROER|nr:transcription factor BTF3 homolog 4 [Drosophila erecta]EDV47102.1 uncharacterized protein Dere_GG17843 [Drosophila erecta]
MDANKLKKVEEAVRIGGRGSVRRKHKNVPSSAAVDEKRLQTTLAKLPLTQVNGIQEVAIEFTDSSELVIAVPKVQGTTSSNLFVITGELVRKSSPAGPLKVAKASNLEADSADKPESQESDNVVAQKAKKPKKPRIRFRLRNKKFQMMLAEENKASSELKDQDPMAGGDSEPKLSVAESIQNSSEDADDSNNDEVALGASDVYKIIVGDEDSLGSLDDDSDSKNESDDKEWNNLSFYSDGYDSQAEQPNPRTSRDRVFEDED